MAAIQERDDPYSVKNTVLLKAYGPDDREAIEEAARLLRAGGLVAIPTETVYGLAADALNPDAVREIYAAKGRPSDNPLIVHIASMEELPALAARIPPQALRLAEAFWPGPLTMVLPKTDRVPMVTSGGLFTVAIRMPSHPVARAIIAAGGRPLAAPSANRSGRPSTTTWQHCVDDLWGRVDAIVESSPCEVGVESTVVSLCEEPAVLLRPGGITAEQLREVLGELRMDRGVLERLEEGAAAPSPGMKYKHYAPRAQVTLITGAARRFAGYVNAESKDKDAAICFEQDAPLLRLPVFCYGAAQDHGTQAARVFDLLREVDHRGFARVFVHAPDQTGLGLAVYNRLIRAAGFEVVRLPEE